MPNVRASRSAVSLTAQDASPAGALFVVSTPIGNLGDMTHRAVETLRTVDTVLCEDTRHSRALLSHYGITTRVESLHEHNEAAATPGLLQRLASGARLALVTDAGTPAVSDPGGRFIAAVIAGGWPVVPVPGASAALAALSASGLAGGPFTFVGFLERKGSQRRDQISLVSSLGHPSVVYEAPQRVSAALDDLATAGCGNRQAVVARELTKQFEEFRRGTVAELAEYYREVPPRCEVVNVVAGRAAEEDQTDPAVIRAVVVSMREKGAGSRDIVRALVERHGIARNEAYRLAHEDV
ncbi:MAG: 16S rRNA (cytidine(1402)-2'-O)-methyltransferase [Gemmatimonadaceae bacterium]